MKSTRANLASAHVIDPNGVYFLDTAQAILRLRDSTVRREVREGRLRIAKRAGRYYLLGEWLLDWIRGGEVTRRPPAAATTNGDEA
jgi:hypothetical protein